MYIISAAFTRRSLIHATTGTDLADGLASYLRVEERKMASTLVEYDLLDLEIEYRQAVRDKSADAALRLTDEGA